ncbi:MAG TPA: LLM class F420-dependent oxidoreductase [Candidatus Limnocylindrales bacterium]
MSSGAPRFLEQPFFGFHMPNYSYPGVGPEHLFEQVVERVQAAEAAGFGLVTVMDHFYQIAGVGPEDEPMLESTSMLAALAARTSRVRLGALVAGVTYRNPAVLAKSITTIDIISGGRAVLGLGAAWNETEHVGYGFDFPPIKERMDRLGEALTICHLMFTEERPTFIGKHYRIERALNRPRPIQEGGPPIIVGGTGERRTLRLAAEHADWTHWFAGSVDSLRHKTEVLEQHCEAVGRDPATIVKTIGSPVLPVADEHQAAVALERIAPERRAALTPATPQRAAEILSGYVEAGFTGFTFGNTMLPTTDSIAVAGEVLQLLTRG